MEERRNTELTPEQKQEELKKLDGNHGCLTVFIMALIVIVGLALTLYFVLPKDEIDAIQEVIKQQIIEPPTITTTQGTDDLTINIYCNSDYNLVEVRIIFYDENNAIIDQTTLQGRDYSKGNTYKIRYKIPFDILMKAERFSYRITEYK